LYLQQLARARRFLTRYRESATHKKGRRRASYFEVDDNLWAFFQNCWHVKDWLKHDTTVDEDVRTAVVKSVHENSTLRHIRDLANGSKHLEPHGRKTPAEDAGMQMETHQDGSTSFVHLIAVEGGRDVTATSLGLAALEAWRSILKTHGLSCFDPPD
jgi:hypothetical protein